MLENALFFENTRKIAAALEAPPKATAKNIRGGRGQTTETKTEKYQKQIEKYSTIKLLPGATKKDRKIALLSLYQLYLYHV